MGEESEVEEEVGAEEVIEGVGGAMRLASVWVGSRPSVQAAGVPVCTDSRGP